MTAPVRSGDPIIVNVPLGERGYDIAIGRGLIADLGKRIAALRPGAAVAIVSDETVAARYLPGTAGVEVGGDEVGRGGGAGDPAVGVDDAPQHVGVHGRLLRGGFMWELASAGRPDGRGRIEVRLDGHAVEGVVPAVEGDVGPAEEGHRRLEHLVCTAASLRFVDAAGF